MDVRIQDGWKRLLAQEWEKPYFAELTQFVRNEYSAGPVFPPASKIFAAFDACPPEDVRVVIIGQDPYHGVDQANGLCFAVPDGVRMPPSLQNIMKEVRDDVGGSIITNGDLTPWAQQGVLLLNTSLTVRAHQAASHSGHGWQTFTDAVIQAISANNPHVVFILWGNHAMAKRPLIDESRHLVLTAAHPSPFSAHRGFFGCQHFSRTNAWLTEHGLKPIRW